MSSLTYRIRSKTRASKCQMVLSPFYTWILYLASRARRTPLCHQSQRVALVYVCNPARRPRPCVTFPVRDNTGGNLPDNHMVGPRRRGDHPPDKIVISKPDCFLLRVCIMEPSGAVTDWSITEGNSRPSLRPGDILLLGNCT